jgi:predicted nucleotidyltransferase
MTKDEALGRVAAHTAELARFKVKSLAIFGSVARGEASADSDVDLLVEFLEPVGLFEFVRREAARHLPAEQRAVR